VLIATPLDSLASIFSVVSALAAADGRPVRKPRAITLAKIFSAPPSTDPGGRVERCVDLFKSFQHFTFEFVLGFHHSIVFLLPAFPLPWFEAIRAIGNSMGRHSVEQLIVESVAR